MAVREPVVGHSYRGGNLPRSLLTYHPFKALWGVFAILINVAQFPLWVLWYIFPFNRPNPKWSLHTAVANVIVSRDLYHRALTQSITPLSLSSGLERSRWEVVQPSTKPVYVGKAVSHPDIKPVALGGTWIPAPPTGADKKNRTTVLHFHGGAFVVGDARTLWSGYAGKNLNKYVADQVLTAGYRLVSNDKGHFPAQLQDAITWYQSLLDRGIPANKIILSGDSAGGNLVLQLLRYIEDNQGVLPSPGAALLFSPWVDMIASFHPELLVQQERYKTDYIIPGFPVWGAQKAAIGIDALDPYLSPVRGPFVTPTPIFVQAGTSEILYPDIMDLYEGYSAVEKDGKKNKMHLHLAEDCPHDVILIGHLLGLRSKAAAAATAAGKFVSQQLGTPSKL